MELQEHLDEFTAAGVHVFALLPEPVELVADFAREQGIGYTLFADADAEVIRRYGILNTLVEPGEDFYGMPWPGSYLSDSAGRVVQKYFNQFHRIRETAALMLRDLDAKVDLSGYPQSVSGAIVATLGAPDLKPYQRVELLVRIDLPEGVHAYGEPAPLGYLPTSVRVSGPEELVVEEPRFPATRALLVEGINEDLEVFEGDVEIRVPLRYEHYGTAEGETVPIEVEVRYQPCDEIQCFTPVSERLHLDLAVGQINTRQRR